MKARQSVLCCTAFEITNGFEMRFSDSLHRKHFHILFYGENETSARGTYQDAELARKCVSEEKIAKWQDEVNDKNGIFLHLANAQAKNQMKKITKWFAYVER